MGGKLERNRKGILRWYFSRFPATRGHAVAQTKPLLLGGNFILVSVEVTKWSTREVVTKYTLNDCGSSVEMEIFAAVNFVQLSGVHTQLLVQHPPPLFFRYLLWRFTQTNRTLRQICALPGCTSSSVGFDNSSHDRCTLSLRCLDVAQYSGDE